MEGLNQEPKFKEFTPEEISNILEKRRLIRRLYGSNGDSGDKVKIGEHDYTIGKSSEENSPVSLTQFYTALALSANVSPDVLRGRKGLIEIDSSLEGKLLSDLKIIDLGCGGRPFFSIVARKLGAVVYTVDILRFEDMVEQYGLRHYLSDEDLRLLHEHHIVLDLKRKDGHQVIVDASGGNFNYVTEAHLASGAERYGENVTFFRGKELAKHIISPNGIYFNANTYDKLIHTSNL